MVQAYVTSIFAMDTQKIFGERRKMNPGDFLEALEDPKKEEETGVTRVKGRVLAT